MKTENAKLKKFMRLASSLMAVTILLFNSVGQAQARILFEDDTHFNINSEGIILDYNDNIYAGAVATGTYTMADAVCITGETYTATIDGTAVVYTAVTGDNCGTSASADTIAILAGLSTAIDADATVGPLVNAAATANTITLTATVAGTIGNYTTTASDTSAAQTLVAGGSAMTGGIDGDTIDIQFGADGSDGLFSYDSVTQDITLSTPGGDFDFSDDNLTTTGGALFSGSSEFHIREVSNLVSGSTSCTTVGEIALDLTTDAIFVCTNASTNTWKSADNNPAPGTTDNAVLTWDSGTSTWIEDTEFTINIGTGAAGDILYYDGTDWINLAESSTAGYILSSDSAGGLSWVADQDTTIPDTDDQDFESVYSYDTGNDLSVAGDFTITTGTTLDFDSTGAIIMDSDAGVTIGGAGMTIASDGDNIFNITSAGTGASAINIGASSGGITFTDANDALTFTQTSAGLGNDLLNADGTASTGSVVLTAGTGGGSATYLVTIGTDPGTAVPFNTTLAQTAIDVATDITNNVTGYSATAVGTTVNITADAVGTTWDATVATTLGGDAGTTDNNTTGGVNGEIYNAAGAIGVTIGSGETSTSLVHAINAVGDYAASIGAGANDNIDDVYNNNVADGEFTMDIDNAGGLIFDILGGSAGPFLIQDDSVTIGEFTNAGGINFDPTSGQDFDVDTLGAGDIILNSADIVDIDGANGVTVDSSAGDVSITAGDDIIFDDAQLTSAVQMTDTATGIDAEYGTTGIIDAFNLLADFTADDGADIVGVEDASLINISAVRADVINQTITYTADTGGTGGNAISVTLVETAATDLGGDGATIAVTVAGNAITVTFQDDNNANAETVGQIDIVECINSATSIITSGNGATAGDGIACTITNDATSLVTASGGTAVTDAVAVGSTSLTGGLASGLPNSSSVQDALERLDIQWGDLYSEIGATLVGIEDVDGNFTATDVEGALAEISASVSINGVDLTFYPEYPDATIWTDGTANKGTLEGLYDTAQDTNYYNWTTTKPTLQDINVQFMFVLPPDFSTVGTNGLQFEYRTGTGVNTDNKVDVYMYERTGAGTTVACGSDLTNTNGTGAGGAFATGQITKTAIDGGCTLTAGDVILIEVVLYDDNGASDFADVGYITLDYDN